MKDSPELLEVRDAEVEALRREVVRLRYEIAALKSILEDRRRDDNAYRLCRTKLHAAQG